MIAQALEFYEITSQFLFGFGTSPKGLDHKNYHLHKQERSWQRWKQNIQPLGYLYTLHRIPLEALVRVRAKLRTHDLS